MYFIVYKSNSCLLGMFLGRKLPIGVFVCFPEGISEGLLHVAGLVALSAVPVQNNCQCHLDLLSNPNLKC